MIEPMFERVFTPIGIKRADLKWSSNQYRDAMINTVMRGELGSSIRANVDVGLLYLREGEWQGRNHLNLYTIQDLPRDSSPDGSTSPSA
ncbi:MAG: hypothetical protein L7V86_08990 [Verrucomicrobiales bacterium]|nr:hypothetical protein [Verrucomicrobiales bacterium]